MQGKKLLNTFDVTNSVVGAVIGADIYIASALSAGILGPFSLVVWAVAGALAIVLALVFAQCSRYVPKVGGPFAYVSEAFNDFWGFLTGWSLWIAELMALPVFAIAFTNYLGYFIHLSGWQEVLVKGLFLLTLTAINVVGAKTAGTVNDVLTLMKLSPLVLLAVLGIASLATHPGAFLGRYTPLMPLGGGAFPTALVLIFWAYVGFELSTLPAAEINNPRRTIPRAIVLGIALVAAFYLLTNFVVYGVVDWEDLAGTKTPLVLAGTAVLGTAICGYLIYSTSLWDKIVGGAVLLAAVPLYVFFSPKVDIHTVKSVISAEASQVARSVERGERGLGNVLRLVGKGWRLLVP
jgi:amino acid transporter